MAPHIRNQGNLHENENSGKVGNSTPNGNPETLIALAAQLVDLLKMGANAN
jgi:polynucleotide 5'-kinase involved in rRNA processing